MDRNLNGQYEKHMFDEETIDVFAAVIQQDVLNVKVLFYIVRCQQSETPVTVKKIADNVTNTRRIGVRDDSNALRFANEEGLIDRKTAEKIVDRLFYASLIYFDVQRPFKFIKLTARGAQVAIKIRKKQGGN